MSSEAIQLIVFDLDGTLLDSVPDLAVAADQAVRSLGYPGVSEAQVRDYVGNGADILIGRSLSRSLTVDPSLPPELLQQARSRFDQFYAATGHRLSHLYSGVKETLEQLFQAGFTLAIVTNKPSQFVPDILQQHGIGHYFSEVIGGDRFEEKKPNPMALEWLLEKYGCQPHQMMMVGDSKNDIIAAKRANCRSFGLTYGYNHGEPIADSAPDYVADQMTVLLDIVSV